MKKKKTTLICVARSLALPLTDSLKVHRISDTVEAHTANM